jgi:uncharacterized membrane protein
VKEVGMLRALRRGAALTRTEKKEFGPVQIIVIGFDELNVEEGIVAELRRLRRLDIVRVVDTVVVTKTEGGELVGVKAQDLTQKGSVPLAGIASALLGLGSAKEAIEAADRAGGDVSETRGYVGDERTWSVADAIPAGQLALVVLLEHRWAIPVRDALQRAGGETLADAWIHPDDLTFYQAIAAVMHQQGGAKK